MTTKRFLKAALAIALTACSTQVSEDQGIGRDAVEAQPRETVEGTFDADQINVLVDFIDLSHMYIALKEPRTAEALAQRDGPPPGGIPDAATLQAVPSPGLVGMLFPAEVPPNPAAHAIDFRVPTFVGTEGQAAGYHGWITEFRSSRIELGLEESTLRVSFGIQGRFYLYHEAFLKPDFFIVVNRAEATAHLGRDPGQTVLRSLDVDIQAQAEGCGVLGICNFLVNRFLANFSSQLQGVLTDKIREVLRDQSLQGKIVAALERLDNVATDADPPFRIDPASIRISGRAIRFKKSR